MAKTRFIPEGYNTVTPYLIVNDCTAAIKLYERALGARLISKFETPDGKIGHAEMKIGNSHIMLADEYPDQGFKSPKTIGGTPVSLLVYVEDVDAVAVLAKKAGMEAKREVSDQFYGDRSGMFEDPFGHVWNIATHIEDVSDEEMKKRAQKLYG